MKQKKKQIKNFECIFLPKENTVFEYSLNSIARWRTMMRNLTKIPLQNEK